MQSSHASVRQRPSQSSSNLVSHRNSPKPIEAMLFMLPGIDASEAQSFKRWATDAGLVHYVRGNGVRPMKKNEFSKPVPGGLKRNAHIFVNGHGNLSGKDHTLCIDDNNAISEKSSVLMEALRNIPRAGLAMDANLKYSIALHMMGCHIGELRKIITPGQVLWESGTFLMYGSRKSADSKDQLPCMAAALYYLGLSKQNPGTYDPLALFEAVARQRSDCISIAGGKLCAAVVAHAPHALRDIKRPLFQIDAAADPHAKQDKRMSGSASALKKLARIESERLATTQESSYPPDEQIINLLINGIQRSDLIAVTGTLAERPDLLNAKDNRGNSLLLWAVALNELEITRFLVRHTCMINEPGIDGTTPLHGAAEKNNAAAINLLLIGNQLGMRADLNCQDIAGNTPLIRALNEKASDAAYCLIDAGADIHLANQAGETPVMLAAEQGDLKLVRSLLGFRPDLYARDLYGKTAMMKAAENGHALLAQALEKIAQKLAATASQPAPLSNQTQHVADDH